jgi:hypothetical protein
LDHGVGPSAPVCDEVPAEVLPKVDPNGCAHAEVDPNGCDRLEVEPNGCDRVVVDPNGCDRLEVEPNGCDRAVVDPMGVTVHWLLSVYLLKMMKKKKSR